MDTNDWNDYKYISILPDSRRIMGKYTDITIVINLLYFYPAIPFLYRNIIYTTLDEKK